MVDHPRKRELQAETSPIGALLQSKLKVQASSEEVGIDRDSPLPPPTKKRAYTGRPRLLPKDQQTISFNANPRLSRGQNTAIDDQRDPIIISDDEPEVIVIGDEPDIQDESHTGPPSELQTDNIDKAEETDEELTILEKVFESFPELDEAGWNNEDEDADLVDNEGTSDIAPSTLNHLDLDPVALSNLLSHLKATFDKQAPGLRDWIKPRPDGNKVESSMLVDVLTRQLGVLLENAELVGWSVTSKSFVHAANMKEWATELANHMDPTFKKMFTESLTGPQPEPQILEQMSWDNTEDAGVYGVLIIPREPGHHHHLYVGSASGVRGLLERKRIRELATYREQHPSFLHRLMYDSPHHKFSFFQILRIQGSVDMNDLYERTRLRLVCFLGEAVFSSLLRGYGSATNKYNTLSVTWKHLDAPNGKERGNWNGLLSQVCLWEPLQPAVSKAIKRCIKNFRRRKEGGRIYDPTKQKEYNQVRKKNEADFKRKNPVGHEKKMFHVAKLRFQSQNKLALKDEDEARWAQVMWEKDQEMKARSKRNRLRRAEESKKRKEEDPKKFAEEEAARKARRKAIRDDKVATSKLWEEKDPVGFAKAEEEKKKIAEEQRLLRRKWEDLVKKS